VVGVPVRQQDRDGIGVRHRGRNGPNVGFHVRARVDHDDLLVADYVSAGAVERE
jgi:hypothetical protein